MNSKIIQIKGDMLGGSLGTEMEGGVIIVEGDVPYTHVGSGMKGGVIEINGDFGFRAPVISGINNIGPAIIGGNIGWRMEGGEIHIRGELLGDEPSLMGYFVKSGRIYHRKELIVDK
jgi:formylmethanofuran dehydrogenase subunit C